MKRHKYILILFFSMLALATRAQVSVKLQAPRQVEVGRQFRVSYVVNTSDVDDLQVGDFEGFRVLYGEWQDHFEQHCHLHLYCSSH